MERCRKWSSKAKSSSRGPRPVDILSRFEPRVLKASAMRDYVLLYVNGRRHEIHGRQVFQSLSDFLRNDLHLTGTKIVCSEGDCGSCTVMLGRPKNDTLDYVTVCGCI